MTKTQEARLQDRQTDMYRYLCIFISNDNNIPQVDNMQLTKAEKQLSLLLATFFAGETKPYRKIATRYVHPHVSHYVAFSSGDFFQTKI